MSKLGTLGARLHHGEVGYDFVKNRKIWYGISILITITPSSAWRCAACTWASSSRAERFSPLRRT
ncbi:hypothetical protein GCM10023238_27800 [Streptomyces heliomycini]